MLLPNKLFSYSQSILPKLPVVLNILKNNPLGVHNLYKEARKKVSGVNEFMEILDCLYALGKIEYDEKEEVLHYVARN